jgi:hypothetical protein
MSLPLVESHTAAERNLGGSATIACRVGFARSIASGVEGCIERCIDKRSTRIDWARIQSACIRHRRAICSE